MERGWRGDGEGMERGWRGDGEGSTGLIIVFLAFSSLFLSLFSFSFLQLLRRPLSSLHLPTFDEACSSLLGHIYE